MIRFTTKVIKEQLEVELEGDLDIESTEIIELELIPTMERYQVVNLNFKGVPFIDSSGIGLLLNAVQTLNDIGSKVQIINVREEVMDIFELLQLPEIIGEDVFSEV